MLLLIHALAVMGAVLYPAAVAARRYTSWGEERSRRVLTVAGCLGALLVLAAYPLAASYEAPAELWIAAVALNACYAALALGKHLFPVDVLCAQSKTEADS